MLTIFTKTGALRTDFTDAELDEISALSEAQRTALDKLVEAAERNATATAALKTEDAALKLALANQAETARAVERATPKLTHHDLYLHQVKKIAPKPPSKQQLEAESAADAAKEALAIARDSMDAAQKAVKDGRAEFASALSIWQNNGQPVPTAQEVARQMAASFKPAPSSADRRQYLTEIDRHAAATAGAIDARQHGQHFRRGADGKRSYPAAMRGRLAPGFVKA